MIIDSHIHVWPDKIAERALGSPSDGLQRFGDGTVDSAIETMERAGIDRGVCLAVADTPERLESANRFVGNLDPDHFIGFGSVHFKASPEENVESLRRHGLKGVKIHPLFQDFSLDDPDFWSILEALQGEFVVLFHVGLEQPDEPDGRALPSMVRDIARNFPKLDIIAAHFGGYHMFEEASECLIGTDVHLDTSWPPGLASIEPGRVRKIIEKHGPDKVVFATDWPMADPAAELTAVSELGFSESDTELILGKNLERLLAGD